MRAGVNRSAFLYKLITLFNLQKTLYLHQVGLETFRC